MNMPRIFKPFNIPATKVISDAQTSLTNDLVTSATLLIYSSSSSSFHTKTYTNRSSYRLKLKQYDSLLVSPIIYYLNPGQSCSFSPQDHGGSDYDDWCMYVEITAFTEGGGNSATIKTCPPFLLMPVNLLMHQLLNKKEDSMTVIKPTVHVAENTINISATATTITIPKGAEDSYTQYTLNLTNGSSSRVTVVNNIDWSVTYRSNSASDIPSGAIPAHGSRTFMLKADGASWLLLNLLANIYGGSARIDPTMRRVA